MLLRNESPEQPVTAVKQRIVKKPTLASFSRRGPQEFPIPLQEMENVSHGACSSDVSSKTKKNAVSCSETFVHTPSRPFFLPHWEPDKFFGDRPSVPCFLSLSSLCARYDLFPSSMFDPSLTLAQFIQRLLVPRQPFVSIAQDLGAEIDDAIMTLRHSAQYGIAISWCWRIR